MSYKKLLAVLPCAALWAALPPKAGAQEPQGMVVARDAQTGQLRAATPDEIRALTPPSTSAAMRAPSQPAMVTHPGGSRQLRLGERGLVYSVVTRGADGKLAGQCVHDAETAAKAVHAATAAAPHSEGHNHD
ncbi:MAG: hypothetical protein ABWY02_13085 [Telluria sp.]